MSDAELKDQIAKLSAAIEEHKQHFGAAKRPKGGQRRDLTGAGGHARRLRLPSGSGRRDAAAATPSWRSGGVAVSYRPHSGSFRQHSGSRHKKLVLAATPNDSAGSKVDSVVSSSSSSQWIKKQERHLQLINAAVYENLASSRARAIEQTRKNKASHELQHRLHKEKQRLRRFFAAQSQKGLPPNETVIGGIRYRISPDLVRLNRVHDGTSRTAQVPLKTYVGGIAFHRSKTGNFWRSSIVKSNREIMQKRRERKRIRLCSFFTSSGACSRGANCDYVHDPEKLAICPQFLASTCSTSAEECPLAHTPSPHNVPTCLFFLKGACTHGEKCKYVHAQLSPGAPLCKDFAQLGYCERGASCECKHARECPEHYEKGVCNNKKCNLLHIDTAITAKRRQAYESEQSGAGEEKDDASSIDDESSSTDSEDVDSDYLAMGEDPVGFEEQDYLEL